MIKKTTVLLLALMFPNICEAAFSVIAHTAANSLTVVDAITSSINTTGANLIVVAVADFAGGGAQGSPPITDSKGNTWTIKTSYTDGSNARVTTYYTVPTSVGSGHTFTYNCASNCFPSIAVIALSGASGTPFDGQNGNNVSSTSIQPGSVTPAENNEILISAVAFDASNTVSINSSFTISDQVNVVSSVAIGLGMAYKIQTTGGAENPTWSWSSSTEAAAALVSFKSSGGGGGGSTVIRHRVIQ